MLKNKKGIVGYKFVLFVNYSSQKKIDYHTHKRNKKPDQVMCSHGHFLAVS